MSQSDTARKAPLHHGCLNGIRPPTQRQRQIKNGSVFKQYTEPYSSGGKSEWHLLNRNYVHAL